MIYETHPLTGPQYVLDSFRRFFFHIFRKFHRKFSKFHNMSERLIVRDLGTAESECGLA
jgi:hypothetical protein